MLLGLTFGWHYSKEGKGKLIDRLSYIVLYHKSIATLHVSRLLFDSIAHIFRYRAVWYSRDLYFLTKNVTSLTMPWQC